MIRNWAARTANQGIALAASLLMRSAIKPLLQVDERSLSAVGLSRADVIDCFATPLTTDPARFLASRGRKARPGRASRAVCAHARVAGPDPKHSRIAHDTSL